MSGRGAASEPGRTGRSSVPLPRAPRRRVPATAAITDRRRRVATLAGGGTAALLAAAAGGATWYYADRITEAPGRRPTDPRDDDHVTVVADHGDEVELVGAAAAVPGWWGVTSDVGWCLVGPPVEDDVSTGASGTAGTATTAPSDADAPPAPTVHRRPVLARVGAPATAGSVARLDADAVPDDPGQLGWPVQERTITGPLGDLPAWWVPAEAGGSERVAVLVHGRSGSRRETARWIPALRAAGWSCLALSYRNAPGAPASPDGRSHLGATEWADLDAALEEVLAGGAREVVLLGVSMGGACIAELLRRRSVPQLAGVVLDAPVRHWGPVLRAAARQRGLPGPVLPLLLPPTMALAGVRSRIDWRGLDHLDDPARYRTPTLLLHGDADLVVPVALSDAFAAARPDIVTYVRVPGAGHVRTWNVARDDCERALTAFLADLPAPSGA